MNIIRETDYIVGQVDFSRNVCSHRYNELEGICLGPDEFRANSNNCGYNYQFDWKRMVELMADRTYGQAQSVGAVNVRIITKWHEIRQRLKENMLGIPCHTCILRAASECLWLQPSSPETCCTSYCWNGALVYQ